MYPYFKTSPELKNKKRKFEPNLTNTKRQLFHCDCSEDEKMGTLDSLRVLNEVELQQIQTKYKQIELNSQLQVLIEVSGSTFKLSKLDCLTGDYLKAQKEIVIKVHRVLCQEKLASEYFKENMSLEELELNMETFADDQTKIQCKKLHDLILTLDELADKIGTEYLTDLAHVGDRKESEEELSTSNSTRYLKKSFN